MKHAVLALLLCLPAGPGVHAQAPAPADAAPTTVRIRLRNDDDVQGFLRGRSTDELVVFTSEGRYRRVPFAEVQRFEVRSRMGSHWKRGALIGVLGWASLMGAARIDALDEAGIASWQSGAILIGGVGLGTAIGAGVPRYGWRPADPRSMTAAPPGGLGLSVALRF